VAGRGSAALADRAGRRSPPVATPGRAVCPRSPRRAPPVAGPLPPDLARSGGVPSASGHHVRDGPVDSGLSRWAESGTLTPAPGPRNAPVASRVGQHGFVRIEGGTYERIYPRDLLMMLIEPYGNEGRPFRNTVDATLVHGSGKVTPTSSATCATSSALRADAWCACSVGPSLGGGRSRGWPPPSGQPLLPRRWS
jgi:hypothetical protein